MEMLYTWKNRVFDFEGAISVSADDAMAMPWRIPYAQRDFFPELADPGRGACCTGVRLVFCTDAPRVVLELAEPIPPAENAPPARFDLYVDGILQETVATTPGQVKIPMELVGLGEKAVSVWLDPQYPVSIRGLGLDPGDTICRIPNPQKRWLHYGSSISRARAAATPSMTWTGIAARELGLNLTNLGYGGRCILAPMIGRLIRDTPCDVISLKLGINVHGGRLGELTFTANAIGLVALIREKHPETPLLVISPVYGVHREEEKSSPSALSLREMRAELATVVELFRQNGDQNIHYMDGLRLFGADDAHLLPDHLHPNAQAQPLMAARIIPELKALMGGSRHAEATV